MAKRILIKSHPEVRDALVDLCIGHAKKLPRAQIARLRQRYHAAKQRHGEGTGR